MTPDTTQDMTDTQELERTIRELQEKLDAARAQQNALARAAYEADAARLQAEREERRRAYQEQQDQERQTRYAQVRAANEERDRQRKEVEDARLAAEAERTLLEATAYQAHIDQIVALWKNTNLELRPYQHRGRVFLRESERALCTLPPGLGKTPTAASACYEDDGLTIDGLVGICCPAGLTDMWFDQWLKFWPDTPIVEISGNRKQRERALELVSKGAKVFVFNYEMLHTKASKRRVTVAQRTRMNNGELTDEDYTQMMEDELKELQAEAKMFTFPTFRHLIFDESHHLKSTDSKRAQAAAEMARDRNMNVYLLSGTPIKRDPDDLYMQCHILMPHEGYNKLHPDLHFSEKDAFIRRYCVTLPSPYGQRVYGARKKPIEELMEKVSYFVSYEEADVYRPPIEEQTINIRMDERHEKAYNSIETAYMFDEITFHSAMEVMHSLRAVTMTPQKIETAVDLANDLHNTYDPQNPDAVYGAVFFTIYQESAHMVADALNKHFGYTDASDPRFIQPLTGEMSVAQRAPLLDQMIARKQPFIVGTLGTISEGKDLSYMKAVVFLEETWTHMEVEQGIDRVRRAGSVETKVNVYYLHATHKDTGRSTCDGEIHAVQHHRGMTAEVIVRRLMDKARASYARKKA